MAAASGDAAAQELSGTVWCWSEDESWQQGTLVKPDTDHPSPGPGKLLIKVGARGPVKAFDTKHTTRHNDTHDKDWDDLSLMDDMHEAPLLGVLRRRYDADTIYTFTVDMLISINPYKRIDDLYDLSGDLAAKYGDIQKPVPHLFSIAQKALKAMMEGENQSILMSGESGAGKTEASKYVMRYLANASAFTREHSVEAPVAGGDGSGAVSAVGAKIESRLIDSIPFLEAFGNAQTINNDNSSRFGKFIKIQFSDDGEILGAVTEHFLLEKSRIVSQNAAERNYHVFYRMCKDATDGERSKWKIRTARDHRLLNQGGSFDDEANDEGGLTGLRAKMDNLGISATEQDTVFQILAGVVNLGDVSFAEGSAGGPAQGADEGSHVSDESKESVAAVAELFELDEGTLSMALCQRTMSAGARSSVHVVQLTPQEAQDNRDALVKAVYSKLFSHLVGYINKATEPAAAAGAKREHFIGILDIFGFEVLERNGFEQLCINYANESLQVLFNDHVFRMEQAEYHRQGIEWEDLAFEDNGEVVDLLTNKTNGLFVMLDQQAMLAQRGSDSNFLNGAHTAHAGKHARYTKVLTAADSQFVVKHYASAVTYEIGGFVSRNNDALHHDLEQLPRASACDMLVSVFGGGSEKAEASVSASRGRARGRGGQHKMAAQSTVSKRFRSQMEGLMTQLNETKPQFIRCVRPNSRKAAGDFDTKLVLHQLLYLGVLETVRIRRMGYPLRQRYKDLATHFLPLAADPIAAREQIASGMAGAKEVCKYFLQKYLGEDGKESGWALGTDRCFLRAGKIAALDRALYARQVEMATQIQRIMRGRKTWTEYNVARRALIRMQAVGRMIGARNEKVRRRNRRAATRLQTQYRRHAAVRTYKDQRTSATKIAAIHRGRVQRNEFQRQRDSAIKIQARVRGCNVRSGHREQADAALKIQTQHRRIAAVKKSKARKVAATRITVIGKGALWRRRYALMLRCVVKLQAINRKRRFRDRHVAVMAARQQWKEILEPREAVLLQSLCRKRRDKGFVKQDRRRHLILTNKPRLMYVDPDVRDVKKSLKGVIEFDEHLKVLATGDRDFVITHSETDKKGNVKIREMNMTDLLGSCQRWIDNITKAQREVPSLADLYYSKDPLAFEMRGLLDKKARTSRGWRSRFFVLNRGHVVWFNKPSDDAPRAQIDITHRTLVQDSDLKPYAFTVTYDGSDEPLLLAAKNPRDHEQWRAALRQTIKQKKKSTETTKKMAVSKSSRHLNIGGGDTKRKAARSRTVGAPGRAGAGGGGARLTSTKSVRMAPPPGAGDSSSDDDTARGAGKSKEAPM